MKELLDLPAERDVPSARVARMRADLVTAMSHPHARVRSVRLRLAITVAAVAAVAGGVLLAMPGNRDGGEHLLAMGPDELSPTLRRAAEQCLAWNGDRYPVSLPDLAVAAQQGHRAQVLFLSDLGYLECDVTVAPGEEPHGGSDGVSEWPHGDLLPGPIEVLGMGMTGDPGEVAVAGRVSVRVHRLVLEHGDGHSTTARLENGVFALISEGDVQADAELVGYDADGREIYRQPPFLASYQDLDRCYTDPSGKVIYGRPGPDCQPAERWTQR
jgi:hypothetical protein